jgi:cellulose synthase/poly-beta-1,6-N-acetylglucosamine synthase-like glycosyltransferase
VAPESELPRVVVVLPIRGADPSLASCLRGLLNQDYPQYEVRIIIDSMEDPAWSLVHEVLSKDHGPRVQVSALHARRETCSLKTSALLQAIGALDKSCQVVALIDADVVPYPGWLRDLVLPLLNPQVGATTGIRWFMPRRATWGSLVRYLWNTAASVQMYALHIPWGGSLALRADVFRRSDLLQKWAVSLWEDTGCYRTIRDLGLQLKFVPAATMINQETTNLKNCFRFIRRQMLNVRLYHGSWPAILAHGLGSALALTTTLTLAVIALATGKGVAAALFLAGLVFYGVGLAFALVWVERPVKRLAHERGQKTVPVSWKTLCALPVVHVVYFACLASACVLGKVSWRGITYEFEGPWDVRMRRYRPYRSRKAVDQGASVI